VHRWTGKRSSRPSGSPARSASPAAPPSSRAVDSPLNRFDYALVDPVIVLDEWAQWEKRWSALFLKGQKIRRETD